MNGKIARELRKLARLVTEKHWTDYVYVRGTKRMVDDCARAKYKFFKQEYKVDPA